MGHALAIRHIRYCHLYSINKITKISVGFVACPGLLNQIIVSGKEQRRKEEKTYLSCMPFILSFFFLQREHGATAINGYRIYITLYFNYKL